MNLTLKIWRQLNAQAAGKFVTYEVKDVTKDMSFLEMLDKLNEDLIDRGEPPVAFEHDCREGICGSCGFLINGVAHGGHRGTTVCQLSMRFFKDGDALTLEPWRARAFPLIRDLVVNRSAFDRIIQAGGFVSAPTGSAPDANAILIPKEDADTAVRCGRLHRVWRLRRRLPERSRDALHRCQTHAPQLASARSAAARPENRQHGGLDEGGTFRQLYESWRVRGGVPQGNTARVHRKDEPRSASRSDAPPS